MVKTHNTLLEMPMKKIEQMGRSIVPSPAWGQDHLPANLSRWAIAHPLKPLRSRADLTRAVLTHVLLPICGMPALCHLRFFLQEMGHQPEAASQPRLPRHSPAAALSPRASHTLHTRFHHCLKYCFLPEPERLYSPSRL